MTKWYRFFKILFCCIYLEKSRQFRLVSRAANKWDSSNTIEYTGLLWPDKVYN